MSRIRIKKFGPVQNGVHDNGGWLDIKKVTIFIGNQGSGKSTVAKLISTFTWIEKALMIGDYNKRWFERKNKLKQLLNYHRLENYLNSNTVIEYEGEAYSIYYLNAVLEISKAPENHYPLPQIMYVPAERNFIAYVKTPKEIKLSSDSLKDFLAEFEIAKQNMKGLLRLPINNVDVEYDKLNDTLNLKGRDYKVRLTEASSGFQSAVPLFIVSNYLSNSVKNQSENKKPTSNVEINRFKKGVIEFLDNDNFTDEQKRAFLSALALKFNKTAFINIVEEPEQNLFPSSQWQMLQTLLEFNNMNDRNKLIVTTHSPYIINYLTLALKANEIKKKICNEDLTSRLENIVPLKSTVNPDDLVIYELNENDGTITKLSNYKGLPNDENFLNDGLGKSNDLFVQLLKLEDQCQ